jgi:hypothetical protein
MSIFNLYFVIHPSPLLVFSSTANGILNVGYLTYHQRLNLLNRFLSTLQPSSKFRLLHRV